MLEGNSAVAGENIEAGLMVETTTSSFRVDVIVQSARQPVLVEFWAPSSGTSKQLASILEKIVRLAAGKIRLARMNIEKNPEIAGQLGIQAIPAVIVFQKGQPIDGFNGSLSDKRLKGFIERLIGPIESEADDLSAEAETVLAAGDSKKAIELFTEARTLAPTDVRVVAGLTRALLASGDVETAMEVFSSVSSAEDAGGALAAAKAALDLASQAKSVGDFSGLEQKIAADPADFQARYDFAVALNAAGKRDAAADVLLEIIRRERQWNDQAARKLLLQFFEAWGQMEPESIAARRKLSVLLFA